MMYTFPPVCGRPPALSIPKRRHNMIHYPTAPLSFGFTRGEGRHTMPPLPPECQQAS